MKIFVTGGTGFIGSHFVAQAIAAGYEVLAVRRSEASRPRIAWSTDPQWLTKALSDIQETDLEGVQGLVHFAAAGVSPQRTDWREAFRVNVAEQMQLLETATRAGVKRFVLCGTCFEYGPEAASYQAIPPEAPLQPAGAYAASKAAGCLGAIAFARSNTVEMAYLRVFHAFGEGQHESNFWPSLRKAALGGADFDMTEGAQERDFIPVEAIAAKFVDVLGFSDLTPGEPEIHNLGSGEVRTLREFAGHWWRAWGAQGKLRVGAIPYRRAEAMRYVPDLTSWRKRA